MPTYNWKKVRAQLKNGRAVIYRHDPFTIKLTYATTGYTQEIDFDTDSGYQYAGISVKSAKHEYFHRQADMLEDEKKRRDDRRKLRRSRRNHLRYRKPRFNNRRKGKKWFAPSLQHRLDNQVEWYRKLLEICPITMAHIEVGRFDTQALEAIEAGRPLPESTDYQQGPRYKHDTLREAVFYRDKYTCQICKKSPFTDPGTILHMHHALYWKGDHTDRMAGLMTVCTDCHTTANHQKDGALWGKEVDSSNKAGAAFMNTVRWEIKARFEAFGRPVKITYGAVTKRNRLTMNIEKTHANDAYCIGRFFPKHRCPEDHVAKRRRNDRRLEKFYDAQYIDSRDGEQKSGKDLSCGRTKRKESRHSDKDLRKFRKEKVEAGRRSIRKQRYDIRPGEEVIYNGRHYIVHGNQNKGAVLSLIVYKSFKITDLAPKVKKDGTVKPFEVGRKYALKGRKEPHKLMSWDKETGDIVMEWFIGVKPNKVKRLSPQYGGWIHVKSTE